jgi:hypothetical protein
MITGKDLVAGRSQNGFFDPAERERRYDALAIITAAI